MITTREHEEKEEIEQERREQRENERKQRDTYFHKLALSIRFNV
jgi:hypothetical protein